MGFRDKIITVLGGTPGREEKPVKENPSFAQAQIVERSALGTPFDSYFSQYQPLKPVMQLYDIIREAIPLVDVALRKRARLVSGLMLDGLGDKRTQEVLDSIYNVRVGWLQRGINTMIEQVVDATLFKGFSVSEAVPDLDNKSINRLVVGNPDNFRIVVSDSGMPLVEQEVRMGSYEKLPRQELLFVNVFGATTGGIYGKPIFASCPFVAGIVVRIMAAVDAVIWRFADPTAISILKGGSASDLAKIGSAAGKYGAEITKAMAARKIGQTYDVNVGIPADGDFKVVLLGADSKPMEVAVDYKLALEQIISASELAPWMFGLSWSTTERLSTNQSDAVIGIIEGNRTAMEPQIERLVDMRLIMAGLGGKKWRMEWLPINLADEGAKADARLKNAQAFEKEITSSFQLRDAGLMDDEQLLNWVVSSGFVNDNMLSGSTESKVFQIRQQSAKRQAISAARLAMGGVRYE